MTITKILHCADLHLGCCPDGNETRYRDFIAGFSRACDLAVGRNADALLIGGDFFHHRSIDPRTLRAAEEQLLRLKAAGIPVIAIEGNHDKAFYMTGHSWMEYLDKSGLLFLLKPLFDEEGRPHLTPYEKGKGAILTLGGVRFVGFGFLGASTRARLAMMEGELPSFEGFTVGMLHSGVDNLRGLDLGAVTGGDLMPWRDRVDLFALGHVHVRWENGWAFNPGAPENIHLGEGRKEKGYHWIEITGEHAFTAEFIPSGGRPARYCTLDVTGLALSELPLKAVEACAGTEEGELLSLRLRGELPGMADGAAIREAIYEAYAPLMVEIKDETRDPAGSGWQGDGGDSAALEREVMLALAREQGFPEWYADAARALAEALTDRPSPESLYDLLAGILKEETPCESSN